MALVKYLVVGVILLINIFEIMGHGYLWTPVNRGSAHRKNFKTPENYDDAGNNCGGASNHFNKNKGKCGECGDDYSLPRPRPNENGGTYGVHQIVEKYEAGSTIMTQVNLTANHKGNFQFALCPLKDKEELETEECFEKHKLELASGGFKYPVKRGINKYKIDLHLPKDVKCEWCVLRWEYVAGNSWGICPNRTGAMGCGNQETFRTCSDIEIH